MRVFLAVAPWIVLFAFLLMRATWWSQQGWLPRLLAVSVPALWSLFWMSGRSTGSTADSAGTRVVRRLLSIFGGVAILLGINGLVLGISPVGLSVSALALLAGFAALSSARLAQPPACAQFVAAGMSLLVGLAAVEIGLRAFHLGESVGEMDDEDYVRQFHYMPPPGSAYVSVPNSLDEFSQELIEINSLGIRGPEIQQGQVDLLLIGDSMIESRQLPWAETLGARLPAALAERSRPANVVAHGVRGWSPLLEWNWYLKVGKKLKPRTVLLFFFWNDLWARGTEAHTFRAVLSPSGRPEYFDVLVEPQWVWFKHVRAMRLADESFQRFSWRTLRKSVSTIGTTTSGLDLEAAKRAAQKLAGDQVLSAAEVESLLTKPAAELDPKLQRIAAGEFWPGLRPFSLWTNEQREAAEVTGMEIQRLAEDVAADGGKLVVVYVPNAFQVGTNECAVARYLVGLADGQTLPKDSGIQTWLRMAAGEAGVELVDPTEAMQVYLGSRPPGSEPLHLRADCHWSKHGQQFMADYLADWFVSAQTRRK